MAKVRHHAKFYEDQSNRCPYMAISRFLRWRPSAILDSPKFKILPIAGFKRVRVRHRIKFDGDPSNHCRVMAINRFSK